MSHIEILDFIEENEVSWLTCRQKTKRDLFKGFEGIANYKLTNDNLPDVSFLVNSKAKCTLKQNQDGSLELSKEELPVLGNSYMHKARNSFFKALESCLGLAEFSMTLQAKLNNHQ